MVDFWGIAACRPYFTIVESGFHFFSNEGTPRERMHIHAERDDADAKLWLYPVVTVAKSFGYNSSELAALVRIVEERREEIRNAWRDHFGEAP